MTIASKSTKKSASRSPFGNMLKNTLEIGPDMAQKRVIWHLGAPLALTLRPKTPKSTKYNNNYKNTTLE